MDLPKLSFASKRWPHIPIEGSGKPFLAFSLHESRQPFQACFWDRRMHCMVQTIFLANSLQLVVVAVAPRLASIGLRLSGTLAASDVALTKEAEAIRWFSLPSEGPALAEQARPSGPGRQKAPVLVIEPKRYERERLHGGNHNVTGHGASKVQST